MPPGIGPSSRRIALTQSCQTRVILLEPGLGSGQQVREDLLDAPTVDLRHQL
jgi:hypothetical protein